MNPPVKSSCLCAAVFLFSITTGCSGDNIVELPVTGIQSPLACNIGAQGLSPYSDNPDSPWAKTYLKPSALPRDLQGISIGSIESNIYQSVYQDYLAGNITEEWYRYLQKSWDWTPDTLNMSRTPIRTKALFAYGRDKNGRIAMVIDCNNNLDLSDDRYIYPHNSVVGQWENNIDSIASANNTDVSFEAFVGNKTVTVDCPVFVKMFGHDENMIFYNMMYHMSARYKGRDMVIFSGNEDLSFRNIKLAFADEIKTEEGKINRDCTIYEEKDFICIDGKVYRILGVSVNEGVLKLEKISTPKEELRSSQAGFLAPVFEGKEFTSDETISLDSFKGRYLLIDYWATWCGPCKKELPMLRELYDKTDRSMFEILGFVGHSKPSDLKMAIKENSITWKQVMATQENGLHEKYKPEGYPSTYLIGPDGMIIAKGLRGKQLEERIMGLLGEMNQETHQ